MKLRLPQIVVLVWLCLNPGIGFASGGESPPPPTPPPPGYPIDNGLLGLFLVAVAFGGLVVLKNIRDKKRSTI